MDINNLPKDLKGKWVVYTGSNKREIGRIKFRSGANMFVVYNCAGNWNRFMRYTGVYTPIKDLEFCEASKPTKDEVLYKGRDYDSSVRDVNEPDHDLEYHDKKCEEESRNENE